MSPREQTGPVMPGRRDACSELRDVCCLQMSKAEKAMQKKAKAKDFTATKSNTKVQKNTKRWN